MPSSLLSFEHLICREHRPGWAERTGRVSGSLKMPVEMPEFAIWYHAGL